MPKVVVIGAGHWGKNLVRNFSNLGALAGICDSDRDAVDRIKASYPEAETWASHDAVFSDKEVETVAIATPAATHGALVEAALTAGKNVFVEKPLCLDLEQAHSLEKLVNSRDQVLMVGHLMLYHPAFNALLFAVRSGDVGTLRYIYSTRLSLGQIRREENALWSFAPHDISMILALAETGPQEAIANGVTYLREGVVDTTLSYLTFPGNLKAHLFVSWLHPYRDHRMVVIGSESMIVFDDNQAGPEKLLQYDHSIGWDGDLPSITKAKGSPIPYSDEEPLLCECRHFLDCVETGERPRSDVTEGIQVLSILDACQRSLNTGQAIQMY
ncbi:MAG: Gfo/Idh/MocA family oxidoreductase [Pseudomonadota bacterium]|nr:Gfo/Idh/MocA family oxidoreductase [Pseudomonadota bacterium]